MGVRAGSRGQVVKCVAHAIDVLAAIHHADHRCGLSEIARATQLSKTATYNILTTLVSYGYVERDDAAQYGLGWELYELGLAVVAQSAVARAAQPYLESLARELGETALLGIIEGGSVLYVAQAEPSKTVRMVAGSGRRSRLNASATGRVLLAFAEANYVANYLAAGLTRSTPRTTTDPAELLRALDNVRRFGYAVVVGENEPDLSSISVPVRSASGRVVAALTVAAPTYRFAETDALAALPRLRDACVLIERKLGRGVGSGRAKQALVASRSGDWARDDVHQGEA